MAHSPGLSAGVPSTKGPSILRIVRFAVGLCVVQLLAAQVVPGHMRGIAAGQEPPRPSQPSAVYLPMIALEFDPLAANRRMWGLQFSLEEAPDRHRLNEIFELPRAREVGMRSIRTNLRWDRVEPENTFPARFDWSDFDERFADYSDHGFDLLVSLVAYPNWATRYQCGYSLLPGMEREWREFVRAAAARYSKPPYSVGAWEIGNEVDGKTWVSDADWQRPVGWGRGEPTTPYGGCWGDRAAQYRVFLQAAYEEIKAVDADAVVVHGGLAYADLRNLFHMEFLDELLQAGAAPYFDCLNYHWFPNVRNQMPGPVRHSTLMVTLARHGTWKPVWITETYRLTYANDPVGSQRWQIEFLTKELPQMLGFPEIERIYWYGWVDYPANYMSPDLPQRGLVTEDRRPKAALAALPHAITHTDGAIDSIDDISNERVIAYRFSHPGSRRDHLVIRSRDGAAAMFRYPAGSRGVRWADVVSCPVDLLLAGGTCRERRVWPHAGRFTFELGADTLFITLPAE